MELVLQTLANATYAASYLALVAVGLVLIFGVMGVINFAHGELYMLGAYATFFFYSEQEMSFFAAVALGLVLVGLFGLVMERALFRPLRDNPLGGLVVSIGLLLCLQAAATLEFGTKKKPVAPPTQEVLTLLPGVTLPWTRVYVVVAAVTLLSALWLFLKRSKFGWALRACAQDPEAAALQGISMNQTARLALFIGAGLAGVAGALTAPLVEPEPHMGHGIIVAAFIIIIVGGIGSLGGAVIAALLYALVHTFVTTYWDGVMADIVGLFLMLLVLVVKPTGLFGVKDRA
ncbi:MAG: branched-chain amino acid ABC transporter permease [Pseudomonadota bacterium]